MSVTTVGGRSVIPEAPTAKSTRAAAHAIAVVKALVVPPPPTATTTPTATSSVIVPEVIVPEVPTTLAEVRSLSWRAAAVVAKGRRASIAHVTVARQIAASSALKAPAATTSTATHIATTAVKLAVARSTPITRSTRSRPLAIPITARWAFAVANARTVAIPPTRRVAESTAFGQRFAAFEAARRVAAHPSAITLSTSIIPLPAHRTAAIRAAWGAPDATPVIAPRVSIAAK